MQLVLLTSGHQTRIAQRAYQHPHLHIVQLQARSYCCKAPLIAKISFTDCNFDCLLLLYTLKNKSDSSGGESLYTHSDADPQLWAEPELFMPGVSTVIFFTVRGVPIRADVLRNHGKTWPGLRVS